MATLITGGTGYIGSETARQLVNLGKEVIIFDIAINNQRIGDIKNRVTVVRGDVSNFSDVLNVVGKNKIDAIYHMGSMLTFESELNPAASFRTNVQGTFQLFEAARIFNVPKLMLTSSRATFGLGIGDVIDDWTIQRPIVFYGWGKLYSEGVGRWYASKYGLDFRSIRYPMMIAPGVRTPGHWAPPMIEDAAFGKSHFSIYGTPDSTAPWLYVKDAARAAIEVMEAPKDKIQTMNYNIAGTPGTIYARDLEAELKRRHPDFSVEYKSTAILQRATTPVFSDEYARKEWGWKPEYDSLEKIVEIFEKDLQELPELN